MDSDIDAQIRIPATAATAVTEPRDAVRFLTRLGAAMIAAGASVTEAQTSLERVADVYGLSARIAVLPTVILIQAPGQDSISLEASTSMNHTLRLDQIAAVWGLVDASTTGAVTPLAGIQHLVDIWDSSPRYPPTARLLGYVLMAVGFGLSLHPSPEELIACLLLGLLVGVILLLTEDSPALQTVLPVVTSLGVGLLVFSAAKYGVVAGPLLLLIPPLVTFLPGAMLTLGMIELTAGDIISGSSRLVAGGVQLILLLFGLLIAANITGLPTSAAFSKQGPSIFETWAPWLSVFIFGVGIYLHRSAPPKSLPWLLLVLMVAWTGQQVGGQLAGGYLGGFVGAVLMTPVAYAIQRWPSAPPAPVSILPAFWMLVPGALGLIKLTELVSGNNQAVINDIGLTIYTLVAIALGITLGQSIYRPIEERVSRTRGRVE